MIFLVILLVLAIVFAVLGAVQNSARYAAIAVIFLAAVIALNLGKVL
jgi:hypothetical protein